MEKLENIDGRMALNHIKIQTIDTKITHKKECYDAIENDLEVLDIIVSKQVEMVYLKLCIAYEKKGWGLEKYNKSYTEKYQLTQAEYEKIKAKIVK